MPEELIGNISNYYTKKSVAEFLMIGQFLKKGDVLRFKGYTTDFIEQISSMHVDNTPADQAFVNAKVCVKISEKVRPGDKVYIVKTYHLFLSYEISQERFVRRVNYFLKNQPDLTTFCYPGEELRSIEKNPQLNLRGQSTEQDILKTIYSNPWRVQVGYEIKNSNKFVLFVGSILGKTQEIEALTFSQLNRFSCQSAIVVSISNVIDLPETLMQFRACKQIQVSNVLNHAGDVDDQKAITCAKEITHLVCGDKNWIEPDGLPNGYPFDYEKVIIQEYVNGQGKLSSPTRIEQGCPERWPKVSQSKITAYREFYTNPILPNEIGGYRPNDSEIIVDSRTQYHCPDSKCLGKMSLTFLEAGPRVQLFQPSLTKRSLKVGILVSGGIAPGINSVIRGIVERHCLYRNRMRPKDKYELNVIGYRDGFTGLLRNDKLQLVAEEKSEDTLIRNFVTNLSNEGGSILGTSRFHKLLNLEDRRQRYKALMDIVERLKVDDIDILYIIGGDGSMRAAHMISTRIKQMAESEEIENEITVAAIPKTMDNDILWVWQSFGFLSAVEKAKEFVISLHTEAKSNPRLCIVQLFGSDSGFVVSHAALASGVCDAVLIPETDFSMDVLAEHITKKLESRYKPGGKGKSPFGMILMAETAIPKNSEIDDNCKYLNDDDINLEENEKLSIKKFISEGRRVQGQTPDALRRGGIKIISRVLQKEIRKMANHPNSIWHTFRVFTNEPRHLIRAMNPSSHDIIYSQRLGILAVDNAMAGFTDFMISQWVTEFVLVPLKLVVLGRKRVTKDGIFWKSVLANTGQPAKMITECGKIQAET